MKKNIGLEMVIDIGNCSLDSLHSSDQLKEMMYYITSKMDTTIVGEIYHEFTPYGITAIAIVADSHIAIHTWPEYKHISIDIFSCKKNIPDEIMNYLSKVLETKDIHYQKIDRIASISK